jgi:hypothetical protein
VEGCLTVVVVEEVPLLFLLNSLHYSYLEARVVE